MRGQWTAAPALILKTAFGRCFHISNKEIQLNEEIRDKEIRVVTDDGEQLGIMSSAQALKLAEERNLDLVKIAPQATPPVCKIMDYGKYRFEQSKREKEAKKNQKVITLKEVRLSPTIDTHDLDVKAKSAAGFLKDGDKVKVSLRFKGRQMTHTDQGLQVMNEFFSKVADSAAMEKSAKLEGRSMFMILAPKN